MLSMPPDVDSISTTSCSTLIENETETLYIYSISIALLQVIAQNHTLVTFKARLKSQKKNAFNSKAMPKISLSDYLNRIWQYSHIEEATLISALIYIDKFCSKSKLMLTELNVHRLVITSLLLAIKYNEDKFFSNVFYAKIGGMTVKQLNSLEEKFAVGIGFDLFVDTSEFQQYKQTLDLNTVRKVKAI